MSTVRLFSSAAVRKSSFVRTTKRPFSYSYPFTSSSHATGLPSRAHTRSNRTGDLSRACSMRKRGRESRTAVWSSTGILTSPNAIEPFQSALAIDSSAANCAPVKTSNSQKANSQTFERDHLGVGRWELLTRAARAKLALSLHPVIEVAAALSTATEIAVIRRLGDFVVARAVRRLRAGVDTGCVRRHVGRHIDLADVLIFGRGIGGAAALATRAAAGS